MCRGVSLGYGNRGEEGEREGRERERERGGLIELCSWLEGCVYILVWWWGVGGGGGGGGGGGQRS